MVAVPPDTTPEMPTDPVAGKTVAEVLGEIVWLMTQDPVGREMKVSEIERLVMPAILQRRFHIRYMRVQDKRQLGKTSLQPVEVIIHALAPVGAGTDQNLTFRFSNALKSY